MKEYGCPGEEIGRALYFIMKEFVIYQAGAATKPAPDREWIGEERVRIMNFCAMTQKREYPGNWISTFVEVDPATFDYGWDNTACGILTLFERYGTREFVPYLCMLDQVIYPTRGLGLTRRQTLVEGNCCDFRVKAGGGTNLMEPTSARKLREWGETR